MYPQSTCPKASVHIRLDVDVRQLERSLGPDFPALFLEAFREAGEPVKRTPAVDRALLRPALASLPIEAPGSAQIRLWRAQIRHDRGEVARARRLATELLEVSLPAEIRSGAERLLAR